MSNKYEIDEEFIDNDKRVIVFSILALLIMFITVICLLVGCKDDAKINDNKKEDKKYIIPELEDTDYKDIIKPSKIVMISSNNYEITYHYDNKTYVTKNKKVYKFVPDGYSSCKYYTDKNFTKLYNFNDEINSKIDIYLSCEETIYTIKYSYPSNNIEEYKLSDGTIKLNDPESDYTFEGWYLDENYTTKVTTLDENIIKYSNNGIINLYAKLVKYYTINYYNIDNNIINSDKLSEKELNDYSVFDASDLSKENYKFLGWSKEKNSMIIDYLCNDKINITDNINLYAVFASSMLILTDNDKIIERRGLTKEESLDFKLPTSEELEIDVPTYIIPCDSTTDKTMTIVSDDIETLLENEIKLSDVLNKKLDDYNPEVGDTVLEKEKQLSWKIDKKTNDPITGDEVIEEINNEEGIKEIIKNNTENNIDTKLKAEWTVENISETI